MKQVATTIEPLINEDLEDLNLILGETSFSDIPSNWIRVSLEEVCQSIRENLNPQDYPDEFFEYYSIPAFQEQGGPIFIEGKHILSTKLVIDNQIVLFGKLTPRVLKVWYVNSTANNRKIASMEFIPLRTNNK